MEKRGSHQSFEEASCRHLWRIQVYRQLSISITEKHIKQISQPFNCYDDKSVKADVEVAFAWQSGHRPLQRGTAYGIDSQQESITTYVYKEPDFTGTLNVAITFF